MRTPAIFSVHVELHRGSAEPLIAQIARQIRRAIVEGRLAPGQQLPSSRTLAGLLGVSRPVVLDAYGILEAQELVASRTGSGTYVLDRAPRSAAPVAVARQPQPTVLDLTPNQPTQAPFPLAAWRAAWRQAATRPPSGAAASDRALRDAIAAHLSTVRGMVVTAEDIVVTAGAQQALDLIAAGMLRDVGSVGLENPGGPNVVRLLQRHGLTPRPICVDEAGLRPETIPAGTAAVIVRPEHQLPLSVQMPLDRRRRLVDAAVDTGFMLVEDDRDHEFSGTLQPPSIWELTRGRTDKVASFGCLCRLLPQELCIGYVLARGARLQDLRHLAALRQSVPPAMVVRAATELLHSVEFHRRLRRLRRICTNKRRMIVEGLAGHPQVMRIHGHSSGSHVYVELVGNRSAEDTARALSRHRINAPTTRRYDWAGSRTGNGLIIGHNQLTEKHLAGAVRLIGRSLDAG
jgi:GntR family transcriptional regulator/MocR family aminotransferase